MSSLAPSVRSALLPLVLVSLVLAGCTTPEEGGGPDGGTPPTGGTPGPGGGETGTRVEDLAFPAGVQGEVVATGLNFPTAVDWDANGTMYVGEVGFTEAGPRIMKIGADKTGTAVVMNGANLTDQLLDITFHDGHLYFSTTGIVHRLDPATGEVTQVVTGLPAWGDHRTDEIVFGPDGRLYVSEGSATNSGVMGLDEAGVPNSVTGVIKDRPDFSDVPCETITVTGVNFETTNPLQGDTSQMNAYAYAANDVKLVTYKDASAVPQEARGVNGSRVVTGPYSPFGTPTYKGQSIAGNPKCTGSVISTKLDGSDVKAVAWGFRNPFGIKFDGSGNLWVANNGYDNRGSRPVGATPDELWRVKPGEGGSGGVWHGWPDYAAGIPLTDPFYHPLFGPQPPKLVKDEPNPAPKPVTFFSAHASANKFDFAPGNASYAGDIFIAEFGTLNIEYARGALTGMDVAHVDMDTGRVSEFITHKDRYSGKFRPVEAKFGPDGRLYVVDFGAWTIEGTGGAGNQGAAIKENFVPGSGRVFAFRLPETLAFDGFPVGNVGGKGMEPKNGTYGKAPQGAPTVDVVDYGFGGVNGTAKVGTPVAFTNKGMVGHTVTDVNGTWNSGFKLAHNQTFLWTPTKAGAYRYYCEVHPVMRGTINVNA